jgi:membrane-anchored mycosin MYCP
VPAIRRTRRQPLTGLVSVFLAVVATTAVSAAAGSVSAEASAAAPAASPAYEKYYIVAASYHGKPENLAEIAGRFLGSAARSTQIFDLNAGVLQPDGGKLTNPAVLDPGWVLVLPWDAVGAGVQYGLPPMAAAPPPATWVPARPARHSTRPTSQPQASGGCAGTPPSTQDSPGDWGMLRMAPQQAWPYSRGAGVRVAIVDSGVDASLPELAGRVTVGEDIIDGTGRGNTDCVGSGTAMAGIIAASSGTAEDTQDTGGTVGMAPDATILPVRVAPTNAPVSVADQAAAIAAAVSAGAKVIALGSHIDPAQPPVASAMDMAAADGVVVALAAPTRSPGSAAAAGRARTAPGVIWVGAISIDGAAAADYQPGTVDVVAPGVDIASLGITGTGQFYGSGTQYAVAFTAGEAALIRARYPSLTAAQVVRRIEATANQMGPAAPDATFGWGLIDPAAAVTRVMADGSRVPGRRVTSGPARGWSSVRTKALAITVLLALLLVLLLALRTRRMVRPAALSNADTPDGLAADTPFGGPSGGGTGLAAVTPTEPARDVHAVAGYVRQDSADWVQAVPAGEEALNASPDDSYLEEAPWASSAQGGLVSTHPVEGDLFPDEQTKENPVQDDSLDPSPAET